MATLSGGSGPDLIVGLEDEGDRISDLGGNATLIAGPGGGLVQGGANRDPVIGAIGITAFGGETGDDLDTPDPGNRGPRVITCTDTDPDNLAGFVTFLDPISRDPIGP